MPEALETHDVRLAAYLAIRGYGEPDCVRDGKAVKYLFSLVSQADVLEFYNKNSVLISPLAYHEKHQELISRSKAFELGMLGAPVFQHAS